MCAPALLRCHHEVAAATEGSAFLPPNPQPRPRPIDSAVILSGAARAVSCIPLRDAASRSEESLCDFVFSGEPTDHGASVTPCAQSKAVITRSPRRPRDLLLLFPLPRQYFGNRQQCCQHSERPRFAPTFPPPRTQSGPRNFPPDRSCNRPARRESPAPSRPHERANWRRRPALPSLRSWSPCPCRSRPR